MTRIKRDSFLHKLKEEWKAVWNELFEDKNNGERVATGCYPLVFVDRGDVVFANRKAKTPSFSEVADFWAANDKVYAYDPAVGGWGRFIRNHMRKKAARRLAPEKHAKQRSKMRQAKKGGRGWLHKH